jgi:3-deoxy-7-phosphoheptulonate synthase
MIVIMQAGAHEEEISRVTEKLEQVGFSIHLSRGVERTIIGAVGDKSILHEIGLEAMSGVERVVAIRLPYKMVSREVKSENTVIKIGNIEIGGSQVQVMAGPCAVESREQLFEAAEIAKNGGATILRGGAYKPRSSPYAFQGLEEEGLKFLAEARERTGLLIVTEVVDPRTIEVVSEYSDILQIGARNMQNFFLLKEVAKINKPVLLKRGLSSTIEEWLMAAEYIYAGGNHNVMLCERGIRTFETATRNTLDLSAVALAKQLSHLPVIVDPSHGTGVRSLVQPMSLAAVASGADGLIVEIHPNPPEALCDGPQSLTPEQFNGLMASLKTVAAAVGRQA